MHSQSMLHTSVWKPFESWGFTHSFWTIQTDTLISTWAVLAIITIISICINISLRNKNSYLRFAAITYTQAFRDMLLQSIRVCPVNHLAMVGSLFTYILLCNTIQIIPWFEEPTKDLNTTFALGLISFLYVHGSSIATKGLKHYIAHYFQPFFLMAPLHVVGAISSIISLSFRLFGNIFGGFIISSLYASALSDSWIAQSLGLLTGANMQMLLLFGIFEGLIQAFVFTMLTMTYLSMEITQDEDETNSTPTHT